MLAVSSGPTIRATSLTYYLSIPNTDLETPQTPTLSLSYYLLTSKSV